MRIGRMLMTVVLVGMAVTVAVPATAHAATSVTYTDAAGDAVLLSGATGNSPQADIRRWTIAFDGDDVILTVFVDEVAEVVPVGQLINVYMPLLAGTPGHGPTLQLERSSEGIRVHKLDTTCAAAGTVDIRARSYTLRTTRAQNCTINVSEMHPVVEYFPRVALHEFPYHDVGLPTGTVGDGYRMVTASGEVHAFGNLPTAQFGPIPLTNSTVDIETTATNAGYLLLTADGAVTAVGDAHHLGNATMPARVFGERAAAISLTPSGNGYWIFSTLGRVIPFGDALTFGDLLQLALNGPVLDAVATPSGNGYYMVASDGGVFAFGDARFHGSMGATRLNAPVQSLVPDPDGTGYWLVASDGGVFSFEAQFRGSMGNVRLNRPVSGMVAFGNGYLMVGEDGGIFNFSDREFYGSLGDNPPASPVVSVDA